MKKILVAILAFLYLNVNINTPDKTEHYRIAYRASNAYTCSPKKGNAGAEKPAKGSRQNVHLQNYRP